MYHYDEHQPFLQAFTDVLADNSESIIRGCMTADEVIRLTVKLRRARKEEASKAKQYYCRVCGGGVDSEGGIHDLCDR